MQEKRSSWARFSPFSYFLHYRWQDRDKDKKITYCLDAAGVAGELPNTEAAAQQQQGDIGDFALGQGGRELPWHKGRLTKLLLLNCAVAWRRAVSKVAKTASVRMHGAALTESCQECRAITSNSLHNV